MKYLYQSVSPHFQKLKSSGIIKKEHHFMSLNSEQTRFMMKELRREQARQTVVEREESMYVRVVYSSSGLKNSPAPLSVWKASTGYALRNYKHFLFLPLFFFLFLFFFFSSPLLPFSLPLPSFSPSSPFFGMLWKPSPALWKTLKNIHPWCMYV